MRDKTGAEPLLSVIVTVYNSEKYFDACLNSLLGQTYRNIEIIIVDDGSQGNIAEVASGYVDIFPNVKFISHSENMGLFQARLTGLDNAKGEFIAFCDSDDTVSVDYYRLMINKSIETGADMVLGDFALKYPDGSMQYLNLDNLRLLDLNLSGNEVLGAYMRQEGLNYSWHVMWNKVVKRSAWDRALESLTEINFPLTMTEDIAFSCALWTEARSVTNIHNAYYYYCQHSGQSINAANSAEKFEKNCDNVAKVFDFFESVLKRKNRYIEYEINFKNWKERYFSIWLGIAEMLPNDIIRNGAKAKVKHRFNYKKEPVGLQKERYTFFEELKSPMAQFSWFETIKADMMRDDAEIISFDIFDTLIVRPFLKPTDLLKLLTPYYNQIAKTNSLVDFYRIRLDAEGLCRKQMGLQAQYGISFSNFEDITLDEIYKFISDNYKIPPEVVKQMKQKEIELELHFCSHRGIGKELFDLAKYLGKRIILVSDMYLEKEIIEQILAKCGFTDYEKLYLSSEERLLKRTGNLFRYVLKDLEITDTKSIEHYGDNWEVDIIMAQKLGLKAKFIPTCAIMLSENNPGIYSGKWLKHLLDDNKGLFDFKNGSQKYLYMSCILGLIANKVFDNPFISPINQESDFNADPRYIGYGLLGPHLMAVADWVKNNAVGKDRVHFTSRDGYVLKQIYELITNNQETNYLHNSRISLASLDICSTQDLLSVLEKFQLNTLSPKKFFRIMPELLGNTDIDTVETLCKENRFVWNKNFGTTAELSCFLDFFWNNLYDADAHNEYIEIATDYLTSQIGKNDVIFDMGYSGRGEAVMSKLLEFPVNSLYMYRGGDLFALRASSSGMTNAAFYSYIPQVCVPVREHMLSELAPSCVGYVYDEEAGGSLPLFEREFKTNYQTKFVTDVVQQNAIQFVKDFKLVFENYLNGYELPHYLASLPYEHWLQFPTKFDMYIFSATDFEDDIWGGLRDLNLRQYWEDELARRKLFEPLQLVYTAERQIVVERAVEVERVVEVEKPLLGNRVENDSLFLNGEVIYIDGLFMKLVRALNWLLPKESKRRKLIKRLLGAKEVNK